MHLAELLQSCSRSLNCEGLSRPSDEFSDTLMDQRYRLDCLLNHIRIVSFAGNIIEFAPMLVGGGMGKGSISSCICPEPENHRTPLLPERGGAQYEHGPPGVAPLGVINPGPVHHVIVPANGAHAHMPQPMDDAAERQQALSKAKNALLAVNVTHNASDCISVDSVRTFKNSTVEILHQRWDFVKFFLSSNTPANDMATLQSLQKHVVDLLQTLVNQREVISAVFVAELVFIVSAVIAVLYEHARDGENYTHLDKQDRKELEKQTKKLSEVLSASTELDIPIPTFSTHVQSARDFIFATPSTSSDGWGVALSVFTESVKSAMSLKISDGFGGALVDAFKFGVDRYRGKRRARVGLGVLPLWVVTKTFCSPKTTPTALEQLKTVQTVMQCQESVLQGNSVEVVVALVDMMGRIAERLPLQPSLGMLTGEYCVLSSHGSGFQTGITYTVDHPEMRSMDTGNGMLVKCVATDDAVTPGSMASFEVVSWGDCAYDADKKVEIVCAYVSDKDVQVTPPPHPTSMATLHIVSPPRTGPKGKGLFGLFYFLEYGLDTNTFVGYMRQLVGEVADAVGHGDSIAHAIQTYSPVRQLRIYLESCISYGVTTTAEYVQGQIDSLLETVHVLVAGHLIGFEAHLTKVMDDAKEVLRRDIKALFDSVLSSESEHQHTENIVEVANALPATSGVSQVLRDAWETARGTYDEVLKTHMTVFPPECVTPIARALDVVQAKIAQVEHNVSAAFVPVRAAMQSASEYHRILCKTLELQEAYLRRIVPTLRVFSECFSAQFGSSSPVMAVIGRMPAEQDMEDAKLTPLTFDDFETNFQGALDTGLGGIILLFLRMCKTVRMSTVFELMSNEIKETHHCVQAFFADLSAKIDMIRQNVYDGDMSLSLQDLLDQVRVHDGAHVDMISQFVAKTSQLLDLDLDLDEPPGSRPVTPRTARSAENDIKEFSVYLESFMHMVRSVINDKVAKLSDYEVSLKSDARKTLKAFEAESTRCVPRTQRVVSAGCFMIRRCECQRWFLCSHSV